MELTLSVNPFQAVKTKKPGHPEDRTIRLYIRVFLKKGFLMENVAIVTGASSGIGWELALECARKGHDLVLVARSKDKLDELAGIIQREHARKSLILPMDLTKSDAPRKLFEAMEQGGIVPTLLVNNAGFGTGGEFYKSDLQRETDLIQLNITALVQLTRLFLPSMIEKGKGFILNVGSVAGFLPGPFMANYYASKAYVLHFSEALSEELKGTGVSATVLCPGPTGTSFFKVAGVEDSATASGGLVSVMDAATVARIGYRGALRRKTIVLPGTNRFLPLMIRLSPRSILRSITGGMNRKRGKIES